MMKLQSGEGKQMFNLTISETGMITYQLANLCCFLFMLPILQKSKTTFGSEMQTKLFEATVGFFLLFIVTDVVMLYYRESNPIIPAWLCMANTIVNEVSLTFVGFFWFLFCAARLNIRRFDSHKFKLLASIPMMLEMILSLSSPLTGLFFTIQNGVYHRGPLYIVQAGAVMSYLILTSIAASISAAHTESKAEKVKALSLIKFIVPAAVAGTMQVIAHNTPVMTMGVALAIYLEFINMQDMQVNNDALTGLNNRRRAEYYLTDCMEEAEKNPFCIYMIDVDHFKLINDQYGHGEGDRALCIVASALKSTAEEYKGFAARVGGDEFILSIFYHDGVVIEGVSSTVNHYIDQKCKEENVPYQLKVSVGYKLCMDRSMQINEIMKNADSMLYQNKKEHHKNG
jgi:diguanylate cyclase (GGDEF)-like protein